LLLATTKNWKSEMTPNHRTQRSPRVRCGYIVDQRRGLAGSDRWAPEHTGQIRLYEESNKRPVLVGRIGFVISGRVHRLPKPTAPNRCRTKSPPRLLGRRRGGRQMLYNHHGQLPPLSCRHKLVEDDIYTTCRHRPTAATRHHQRKFATNEWHRPGGLRNLQD